MEQAVYGGSAYVKLLLFNSSFSFQASKVSLEVCNYERKEPEGPGQD
jgi:hypothetical protein